MSDNAQADKAVQDLGVLVHRLADELAGFRRRALVAEARVKEMENQSGVSVSVDVANRCSELEQENERLRMRLDSASARARQMLDRVKFLRQQAQGNGGER